MKIPAVMIYSRKTKLVFWATFKMDVSPHQSNKYTDVAVAAAASLNLFIALNCAEQRQNTPRYTQRYASIAWYFAFDSHKSQQNTFGVPKEPLRITASETSEVKCACFGELYYA